MNCIKDDWPFSVSDIQEEVLLSIFLDIRTKNLLCFNEQITWTQQPKVQKSLGGHSVFVVISLTVLKTCKEQKSPSPSTNWWTPYHSPQEFDPGVNFGSKLSNAYNARDFDVKIAILGKRASSFTRVIFQPRL